MVDKNKLIFYDKCKNIFKNKYSYFNDYIDHKTAIQIKCNIHNIIFNVTPRNHIRSSTGSCHQCKHQDMINRKRKNNDYFINKSKNIFKNRFNYFQTNYINKMVKVSICCNKHNYTFKIIPIEHYKKNNGGCKYCKKDIKDNKNKLNIKNIIKNNNNFDFTNINYTLNLNKKQKLNCHKCNKNIKILLTNLNCPNC